MSIFAGIDDTDNLESRGTGRLTRSIAAEPGKTYGLYGVTRHQLLVHPDIPYTSQNSAAVIHLDGCGAADVGRIFHRVKKAHDGRLYRGQQPGKTMCFEPEKSRA
jgi:hypothetical protein